MFTGIIETMAQVKAIRKEGTNVHISLQTPLATELKIDQSVAHNGVCLTVVDIQGDIYTITAIEETLKKTNLGELKEGDYVNLERALPADGRLDGHFVQGHVDTTGHCEKVEKLDGSWYFHFSFEKGTDRLVVDKGSICINGVSLTVVESTDTTFSVAIIPYTYEHTTFQYLKPGSRVNLEFDIVGKYLAKYFGQLAKQL